MNVRRIATIFRKDLRDAIRDARVLVALIVPLGIGIFYDVTFDDDTGTPSATVAYYAPDRTMLPNEIAAVAGDTIDLTFEALPSADAVQREIGDERADLGVILPAGFDAAVHAGQQPPLDVVQRANPSFAGDYALAAIEPALHRMAGQAPPAQFRVAAVAQADEDATAIDKVGLKNWSILASIATMVAMIAMLAVPVILAEENERKTLDALVLVASYAEVVIAKALVGIAYIAVMVPLLMALTTTSPDKPPLFVAAVAVLGVALIGFGLLMAGIFKSANQLNTWSGVMMLPVIAPSFVIGIPAPDSLQRAAAALPTGAAAKLMMNAMADERVFAGNAAAFAIIVAWGAVAYALLLWQLSRRQA